MFTENEQKYFERYLNEKFENLENQINKMIDLQESTNQRVDKLEEKVASLDIYKAESQSSWRAWSKAATLGGGVLGAILGYIANKLL